MKRWLLAHPLARYNKALVGLVGLLGQLVPALALHGEAERIAEIVLAVLTALGTYSIPNAEAS